MVTTKRKKAQGREEQILWRRNKIKKKKGSDGQPREKKIKKDNLEKKQETRSKKEKEKDVPPPPPNPRKKQKKRKRKKRKRKQKKRKRKQKKRKRKNIDTVQHIQYTKGRQDQRGNLLYSMQGCIGLLTQNIVHKLKMKEKIRNKKRIEEEQRERHEESRRKGKEKEEKEIEFTCSQANIGSCAIYKAKSST